MAIKKIIAAINSFLNEPDELRIQLIDINIPDKHIQLRVMDSKSLLLNTDNPDRQLVIHISVKGISKKSHRIRHSIEASDFFKEYVEMHYKRESIYYKVFGKETLPIATELINIIEILHPGSVHDKIGVEIRRTDNWITLQS